MRNSLTSRSGREEREKRALARRRLRPPVSSSSVVGMSQLKLLVWLFILSQGAVAQIQHTSKGETDQFLLCSRSLFQKPVYTTVVGPWFDATMKCSSDRAEVLHELEERKITVFENESAILLIPPRIRPDIRWQKFDVKLQVMNFDDLVPPGSRALTKEEQGQISKVIFEQALVPPLVPGFAHVAGDTGEISMALILDAHHLSPETESVVAVFGPARGKMHLVYGELTHGVYRVLWDTPLLGGPDLNLSYRDVDGDGIPEIVLRWTEAGGNVIYDALAVFNVEGEELTRQQDCYPSLLYAESAQFACAIWGASLGFEKTISGRYDILDVPGFETNPQDAERYTLVDGHYTLPIPVLTAVEPTRLSVKMVNGKMTLIGRNFIRNSEVRFTQTSGESANNDSPREIRVRAEFVSPRELGVRVSEVLRWGDSTGDWQVRVQNASGHSGSLVFHVGRTH
jgi:hypothetical protein